MLKSKLNKGIEFLKQDKYFAPIIANNKVPIFPKETEYFQSLIKYIIYQQLSIKSARKIYDRLLSLFEENKFNFNSFLSIPKDTLKKIGISSSKINYMHQVAKKFKNNKFFLDKIDFLPDQEIIDQLIEIKGIGPWTADMFLMFTLQRLDIFPIKDLGIKKGMQKIFNLKNIPSDNFMIKRSKRWSPYRTIVCLYLWKIIDENDFEW